MSKLSSGTPTVHWMLLLVAVLAALVSSCGADVPMEVDSNQVGCLSDNECKGDRLCENGKCVSPDYNRNDSATPNVGGLAPDVAMPADEAPDGELAGSPDSGGSTSSSQCGDGVRDPGEWCDPGVDEDVPCSSVSAQYKSGSATCTASCTLDLSGCVANDLCGNNTIDAGEQCDDGNTLDGDGCSAACTIESAPTDGLTCGNTDKGGLGGVVAAPDTFCDNAAALESYVPGKISPLRLRVHIIDNGKGKRSATTAQVDAMIAGLNPYYAPAGISFVRIATVDSITSATFFNLNMVGPNGDWSYVAYNALAGTNADAAAVDVYLVNTFTTPGSGVLCGMATDIGPQGNASDAVVLRTDCGAATLAHELGHVFGLWHTHHPDTGTCSTSGDLCCDTPADPGPAWAKPEGSGTCSNAELPTCVATCPGSSSPNASNVMSYYDCGNFVDPGNFSTCQRRRLTCYLDRHYQYAMVPACIDKDSDGYGVNDGACEEVGMDCDDGKAQVHPGAQELCNDLDDDCDGQTDEGLTQACGSDVGECQAGVSTCALGVWGSCEGEILPSKEVCDAKDNDCDGKTDEDLDPLKEAAANKCPTEGVCANGGAVTSCQGGIWTCDVISDSYVPVECKIVDTKCGLGATSDPTCSDGADNDCDGAVDENKKDDNCLKTNANKIGKNCGISQGACQPGTYACAKPTDGTCSEILVCSGAVLATDEDCSGKDLDCNGIVNDRHDYDLDGYGDCSGTLDCDETKATVYPGAQEVCNGTDDDCDGQVDEGTPGKCGSNCCTGGTVCINSNCVSLANVGVSVAGTYQLKDGCSFWDPDGCNNVKTYPIDIGQVTVKCGGSGTTIPFTTACQGKEINAKIDFTASCSTVSPAVTIDVNVVLQLNSEPCKTPYKTISKSFSKTVDRGSSAVFKDQVTNTGCDDCDWIKFNDGVGGYIEVFTVPL